MPLWLFGCCKFCPLCFFSIAAVNLFNDLLFPTFQLHRSPIKKVRKSLALDILDDDLKVTVSTTAKPVCYKRAQVSFCVVVRTPKVWAFSCLKNLGSCFPKYIKTHRST